MCCIASRSGRWRARASCTCTRDHVAQVQAAARAATREVQRIERKYSRYRDDSVVAGIDASAGSRDGYRCDEETAALLDYAHTAWEQSDGLFDITSGVLREVWDFRANRIPHRRDVERVLERVGWQRLVWERPVLRMPAGMQVDFGGFGKEYAADRAAAVCRAHGIASGLVDLGGDVALVGPHPDGGGFRVGVRDPRRPRGALASILLDAGGIATSGDYQRFLVVDGRRYAHILDPRTGWPVRGLASVSVVADGCLVAGTASTVAMLKGGDGARWLAALGLPHLCVDSGGGVSGTLAGAADYGSPGTDTQSSLAESRSEPSSCTPGAVAPCTAPGITTT